MLYLSVALLIIGTQALAETKTAIGIAPIDRGISFWLVRPKTLIGFEIMRLKSEEGEYNYGEERYLNVHNSMSLTLKRLFDEDAISPFLYASAWYNRRDRERTDNSSNLTELFFENGYGLIWKHKKKLALLVRQGIVIASREDRYYPYGEEPYWERDEVVESSLLEIIKTRVLLLIHF